MNPAKLAALILTASAASFAGGKLSQPDLYAPLANAHFLAVHVIPDGRHPACGDAGSCWLTHAIVSAPSESGKLPAIQYEHWSPTNKGTIAEITALIENVILPAFVAQNLAPLALKDVYPVPTLAHVQWAGIEREQFVASVSVPSLVQGVPPLVGVVRGDPPALAKASVEGLVETHLKPAVRAETGLK